MATRIEDVFDKQQHASIFSRVIGQQVFWVFLAAVAAVVYLSLATDTFDTPRNLFNVGRNFAFVAIIGFGMTAVIASGGIDLSVGSVVVMSAMVMSVTMDAGHSLTLGIVLALLVSVGIGAFNGVLIAILGMPAFVVTLGMLSLARSLAMVLSGNKIMSNFGPDQAAMFALGGGAQEVPFPFLGTLPVPNPVFVMAALGIATGLAFRWTRWGQYVFAIGGNENAARLTGVPVAAVKISVYAFSAFTAGIAGILIASWLGSVTMSLGSGMELTVIAAAVIGGANLAGGMGTAIGAIVGALLIEVIRNSLILLGISAFWHGAFVGTFIILAVGFDQLRRLRGSD